MGEIGPLTGSLFSRDPLENARFLAESPLWRGRQANCHTESRRRNRMRVGVGPLLLGIVTVLCRSNGYTALADAIAMGYLALVTTTLYQASARRPALRPVHVPRAS